MGMRYIICRHVLYHRLRMTRYYNYEFRCNLTDAPLIGYLHRDEIWLVPQVGVLTSSQYLHLSASSPVLLTICFFATLLGFMRSQRKMGH